MSIGLPAPFTAADVVVVQHFWLDANTRRGVDATVTFTPVVSGSSTVTPNLIDSGAHGWVKTRTWSVRPDPFSGYFAVPLTATNDPDLSSLTGFGGYRVQAGAGSSGEAAFTIAVDAAAGTTTVTEQMSRALAQLDPSVSVAVGSQVKTVWLTDLVTTDPPPPPGTYFTAPQTTALVLDAVAAHDADLWAHSGPTPGWRTHRVASSNLSGHRLVVPTSTGSLEYADRTISGHRTRPIWMTLGAALSGQPCDLQLAGAVTEPSWSWTPGPLYLGTDGQITQTLPTTGFFAQVGYATSPTSIYLDRQPSVVLA